MARATAATIADRVETLQQKILEGASNTVCIAYARHEWGVSRAQAYRLLKRAWHQIAEDIDRVGIDRREMLSWAIHQLQSAAGLALNQKNPGAVVGAIREMDVLLGLGASRNAPGQRWR
ncbi:hypothetical protein [Synechococcus sp. LTW-R]|uniref:hypothetical protein n=1 Tax=Synechococcus sp. LTW-R TaxID=2751170 RepID=UPI001628CA51|nr:hypothetical protein [Synechococcus sp. LTW-R]QNG29741.1 hypothetical protein H0O22_00695 [Synechococcus sp. LTW-R]